MLGARNAPAVDAVLRGGWLADGGGGGGAGDVAVESSHVLQSVSQFGPERVASWRVSVPSRLQRSVLARTRRRCTFRRGRQASWQELRKPSSNHGHSWC